MVGWLCIGAYGSKVSNMPREGTRWLAAQLQGTQSCAYVASALCYPREYRPGAENEVEESHCTVTRGALGGLARHNNATR